MSGDHFVPKFLLKRWATKGQMVSYRWNRGLIKENCKAGIKAHCAERGLNSFWGEKNDQKRMLETYFTEKIDTPAAIILDKILRHSVRSLNRSERTVWAKFLVALPLRTPDVMSLHGPAEAEKALVEAQDFGFESSEYQAIANETIRQHARKYLRDFPRHIAVDLIEDPNKFGPVLAMKWSLRRWPKSTILIGDRPLFAHPQTTRWQLGFPLDDPRCLIALPVAPNVVFFATFDTKGQQKRRDIPLSRLANLVNDETIDRCADFVFASDTSLKDFVGPRLTARFKRDSELQ